jgi:hypothetical protein
MSLKRSIQIAYENKLARGWDRTYWAIDLHGTICPGGYYLNDLENQSFYPMAEEALKTLTADPELILILWTCSHEPYIEGYLKWFKKHGIKFDFINSNLECLPNEFQDFSKKFYCNVILDDKAGFNPLSDWQTVLEGYIQYKE